MLQTVTVNAETRHDAFDIAKFAFSFVICAIHTMSIGAGDILFPYSRICVPVFFIISSYLFFERISNTTNEQANGAWKKFILRNFKLYCFWFVVLMPITISQLDFSNGVTYEIVRLAGKVIFGSTFGASWYLAALVIDVSLVFLSCKHIKIEVLLVVSFLIYVVCCMASNYRGLFNESSFFVRLVVYTYPGTIYNSFPVGFFWVAIGKMLVERRINISTKKAGLLTGISLILLIGEYWIIQNIGCCVDNDCYFMLVSVCVSIFMLLNEWKILTKYARILRRYSTIIYCMHASIAAPMQELLRSIGLVGTSSAGGILLFVITISVCLIAAIIIMTLAPKKGFGLLKWAY